MQEIGFDCPETLAQKFWIACRLRKLTPGAALREFMVAEIAAADAGFEFDLRAATGKNAADVAEG
jgi:hypothetical protein